MADGSCESFPWPPYDSSTAPDPLPPLGSLLWLFTFLLGCLIGMMLASSPIDFHVTDTCFVVAHFCHELFGMIVFATHAGITRRPLHHLGGHVGPPTEHVIWRRWCQSESDYGLVIHACLQGPPACVTHSGDGRTAGVG